MYSLPDCFYDVNIISVTTRLLLAMILGGIIGLERGANRHPAGFRTHILVCVGAALAMMTNQFIFQSFDTGDPARLGAQVITGVGFLGVGTILVTGRHKIKGLTTAAGLWASACLGLALGIGFYSGAIVATVIILISLILLPRVENYFYKKSRVLDLYMEVDTIENFKEIRKYIRSVDSAFYETHLGKTPPVSSGSVAFHLSMMLNARASKTEIIATLEGMAGVDLVEEV